MPNLDTGWIKKSASSGSAKATAEFSLPTPTNTTQNVTAAGRCFGDTIVQNGVRCTIGVGAAGGQAARSATNTGVLNAGAQVAACSGTWAFPRQVKPYTVPIYVQFNGETVNSWLGFYRGSDNSSGPFKAAGTVTIPALPVTSADTPTNCVNTRVSDTQNNITWQLGSNPSADKTNYIERQVDVGSWSQHATVKGNIASYSDKTCSPNHSYRYRVRTGWSSGYTPYATSGVTYNTPAAPGKPAVARIDASTVRATFANPAKTATATEMQRSPDLVAWVAAQTQSGGAVTSIDDTPGGGTWYYRARNTRGTLTSAWSPISDPVVTICPPAAPSLISPASSAIISSSDDDVTFRWTHNPIDGSPQTSAEVQYRVNGGTPSTIVVPGSASSYALPNNFAVNDSVEWQARTKGADPSFSPWSSSRIFKVYQSPAVNITTPDETPITELPLMVSWSYTDLSGTQQQAVVRLITDSGETHFSRTIQGPGTTTTIASADYLPANHATYTLSVSVRSSTSLVAADEIVITTDYIEPAPADTSVSVDEQHASVELAIFEGDAPGVPDTVDMGIRRRRKDGTYLVLADHADPGTAVIDIYPPLDEPLIYEFIAYAATGAASFVTEEVIIPSEMTAFLNFGDGYSQVAKIALDTTWNHTLLHSVEVFETAGDEYPLVFFGRGKRLSGSVAGTAVRDDKLLGDDIEYNRISDIDDASDWTGPVILRFPYEVPFASSITVTRTTENQIFSTINIIWERVRARGLAI